MFSFVLGIGAQVQIFTDAQRQRSVCLFSSQLLSSGEELSLLKSEKDPATAVAGGSGSGSNRSVGGNEPAQVQCTEF
ncbi:hypothetical protein KQX54_020757 [Cotesia glomerata]|uniref:Uncharacterized protein n=1 Tax=Cotesia glomerata TaxID=32391 RepID=A0AAV7IEL1_COTGL|nr:hypothetical protein KQX54_020757 [Cotesia glomerata]